MNKRILLLTVILIIVAALALIFLHQKKKNTVNLPPRSTINISNQPTINNHAKITIVALEDMKCANCMRYSVELFPKIQKKYIDTKKANYVTIPLAFIPGSKPAANAALCLEHQDTAYFFQFVDYLFHHQPDERLNWASEKLLLDFASHVPGANLKELQTCMDNQTYYEKLANNLKVAEEAMNNAVSTPTIFVNGYRLHNLTMKNLDQLIEEIS